MFIFWGTKLVLRVLGFVADFCPACHAARAFKLERVGVASHVYYLSFGEGRLAGHQRTCQECRLTMEVNPAVYAAVSKQPASLEVLLPQTFPNFAQIYQARLALEERIRVAPGSLSPDERRASIWESVLIVSRRVEKRFASTHIDRETGFALLGWMIALLGGLAILQRTAQDSVEPWMLGIFVIGGVAVTVIGMSSRRRYMRREVIPVVVRMLRAVNPQASELEVVLNDAKAKGHKIGSNLKIPDLLTALASA